MNWSELPLTSKNELMKLYIQNGITSLDEMKNHYNSFATGGKLTFQQWKAQMQSKYPYIEMDNNKAGYDYETYFNDNYDEAIAQLSNLRHFPDTYKLYNHPTFSNESIYSRGPMIGGSWGYAHPWDTQWSNTEGFTPSIVNRQVNPEIYKEDRPYTEEEIYGRKFDIGGPIKKYPFLQTSWRFEENPEPEKVAAYWPSVAGETGWLPEVNIEASPNTEKGIAINTMLNNMSKDEKNHFFTIYPRSVDGSITNEGQAYLRNQYYRKHFGKSYDKMFTDKLGDRVGITSVAVPTLLGATAASAALGYGALEAAPYIVYGAERALPAIEQTAIRAASSTLPQELGKQLLASELSGTAVNLGTNILSGGKYQTFPDVVKDFTKGVTGWDPKSNIYTNALFDLANFGYYTSPSAVTNTVNRTLDYMGDNIPIYKVFKNNRIRNENSNLNESLDAVWNNYIERTNRNTGAYTNSLAINKRNNRFVPNERFFDVNPTRNWLEYAYEGEKPNFKEAVKGVPKAIRHILRDAGYNAGNEIFINPLAWYYKPKSFKGLLGHEAQHRIQTLLPKEIKLGMDGNKYTINNTNNRYTKDLLKPFERRSEKWEGSPEELDSEIIAWKLENKIPLSTDFLQLSPEMQQKFIDNTSELFKLENWEATNILNNLSRNGYF